MKPPATTVAIEPWLRDELARRFKDRNAPGYWGNNARAWLKFHIKAIRAGKPYGHRSY